MHTHLHTDRRGGPATEGNTAGKLIYRPITKCWRSRVYGEERAGRDKGGRREGRLGGGGGVARRFETRREDGEVSEGVGGRGRG